MDYPEYKYYVIQTMPKRRLVTASRAINILRFTLQTKTMREVSAPYDISTARCRTLISEAYIIARLRSEIGSESFANIRYNPIAVNAACDKAELLIKNRTQELEEIDRNRPTPKKQSIISAISLLERNGYSVWLDSTID